MAQPPNKTDEGMTRGCSAAVLVTTFLVVVALGFVMWFLSQLGSLGDAPLEGIPYDSDRLTEFTTTTQRSECQAAREGRVPSETPAELSGCDLSRAHLSGADLSGAQLQGADLTGAALTGTDLSAALLGGASLWGADLTGANLTRADLGSASLTDTDLTGANLTGASLPGAHLGGASLAGANLTGANLTRADLGSANLTGANLTGATVTGVVWFNTTCPDGSNSGSSNPYMANTCVGHGI